VLIAIAFTALAAKLANQEFREKKSLGYNFTKGDQEFSSKTIIKLVTVAFTVAFFSGVAGLGPGLIFNSVLVQLDMHPAVASATGMYCTMFTTLAGTINILINKQLNMPFSALICLITFLGTMPGLYGQNWIVRKAKGRT